MFLKVKFSETEHSLKAKLSILKQTLIFWLNKYRFYWTLCLKSSLFSLSAFIHGSTGN